MPQAQNFASNSLGAVPRQPNMVTGLTGELNDLREQAISIRKKLSMLFDEFRGPRPEVVAEVGGRPTSLIDSVQALRAELNQLENLVDSASV